MDEIGMRERLIGRPITRRKALAGAAATALPLVLAACGGGSSSGGSGGAQPKASSKAQPAGSIDHLTMLASEPNKLLDVTRIAGTTMAEILLGLEPLLLLQPDGSLAPNLAEHYSQPDATTYRFKIRKGAKFWDGSPVTAEDVAYSFEINTAKGTESLLASSWVGVKSISVRGNQEVEVQLEKPNSEFAYVIGISGIVSKAYREAHLNEIGTPKALNMGSGPYKFVEFIPDELVRLERNPIYWGAKPRIKSLDVRFISEPAAQLLAMQSGNADGIFIVPRSEIKSYESIDGIEIVSTPGPTDVFFAFNVTQAPWSDIHVRRAVGHAVDRKGLINAVANGYAVEAQSLVPKVSMKSLLSSSELDGLYEKLGKAMPAFDMTMAKEEMAKSSVPNGFTAPLLVPQSEPEIAQIAQAVQPGLEEIGIKLEIQQLPTPEYETKVFNTHDPGGISLLSFSPGGPDPASIPQYVLNSAQTLKRGGTGLNIAEIIDPELDKLIDEQAALPSQEAKRRGQVIGDLLLKANEQLPYLPIYNPTELLGIREPYEYTHFSAFWYDNRWPELIGTRGS